MKLGYFILRFCECPQHFNNPRPVIPLRISGRCRIGKVQVDAEELKKPLVYCHEYIADGESS